MATITKWVCNTNLPTVEAFRAKYKIEDSIQLEFGHQREHSSSLNLIGEYGVYVTTTPGINLWETFGHFRYKPDGQDVDYDALAREELVLPDDYLIDVSQTSEPGELVVKVIYWDAKHLFDIEERNSPLIPILLIVFGIILSILFWLNFIR